MKYLIAEKFKSVQGEGVYAGTPMAFIRFVGCSVGKGVCVACDTDWEQPVPWRGGGEFDEGELFGWAAPYKHICLTGGEPFDQNLLPFLEAARRYGFTLHIETSGTKDWPVEFCDSLGYPDKNVWICVSPKPGFKEVLVMHANEVKVIMPGLGVLKNGVALPAVRLGTMLPQVDQETGSLDVGPRQLFHWPTLEDALRWAWNGATVFIQPRNQRAEVDGNNLRLCQDIVAEHPELRLSVQLHKILKVQ